jgi:hypothetical protein
VAEDDPARPDFRSGLAESHFKLGELLWGARKLAEAKAEFSQMLAIEQKLVDDYPTNPGFQTDLANSLARVGRLQQAAGREAEAVHALRQAIPIMERLPRPTRTSLFDLARYHALLSGVLGRPGTGPAADARAAADQAMSTLHQAFAAGFRNLAEMRTDADLHPLRGRDDFRLLLMDLAFPPDPFAHRD